MGRFRKHMMEKDGREFSTDESYKKAYKEVKKIKDFYMHLLVYLAVNAFIIISDFNRSLIGGSEFWNWNTFSTALFWGIGLVAHGASVFGKNIFFGSNWEEKKIQEFMDKDKKQKWE